MIHDERLRRLFEMQKSITIHFYALTKDGLGIYYHINGELNVLGAGPAGTCKLLKDAGLIRVYDMSDKISWETTTDTEKNGEHVQETETVYGSFEDFVEQTKFSMFDAHTIAALYELNKIEQNKKTIV